MIFGLVEDKAYCGSFKTNPFNFRAFDLERITLIIDNTSKVININPEGNDYSEAYHTLCGGLRQIEVSYQFKNINININFSNQNFFLNFLFKVKK